MSQSIQIRCPGCEKSLQVPTNLLGSTVKCKSCGHSMQLKKKTKDQVSPEKTTSAPPPPRAKTPVAQPSPIVESLPETTPVAPVVASSEFPFGDMATASVSQAPTIAPSGNATRYAGKYKGPKQSGGFTKIILGLAVVLVLAVVGVVAVKPDLLKKLTGPGTTEVVSTEPNSSSKSSNAPVGSGTAFPRRLLSINVNNYLFLNPLQYGESTSNATTPGARRDLHTAISRLADGWKIPREQIFELSDTLPADEVKADKPAAKLPLKDIVQESVKRFCESSRPFDRIVILFTGHAVEKKGEAYFAPVEGELSNEESLVPIAEIYKYLESCPAQQKLVIWDVCRFDPGRGNERPSAGKMTAKLEKALHESAPEDVSVFTSCSQDQYSYEFDYAEIESKPIFGSIFLNQIFYASSAGALSKGTGKAGAGIQTPEDAIPVQNFVDYLTKQTEWFAKELVPTVESVSEETDEMPEEKKKEEKKPEPKKKEEAKVEPKKKEVANTEPKKKDEAKEEMKKDDKDEMAKEEMPKEAPKPKKNKKSMIQSPKFTLAKKTKETPIDLAMAPIKMELPNPPAIADATEVKAIFEEIRIPAIKASQQAKQSSFDTAFPFTAETIASYKSDVTSVALLKANPEKFKLRLAVLEVVQEFQTKLGKENSLRDQIRGESNDAAKREILQEQRGPATQQFILEELKMKLEGLKKEREAEPSKRWQANYDYLLAQVKLRLAYLSEYNLILGKVRKDELPPLDPALKHKGWKLAAVEKMKSPKEIRDMVDEAKEILNGLIENHPNTPWAVLAKREKNISLGLEWQASSFGE
jgi:hypothetical protein